MSDAQAPGGCNAHSVGCPEVIAHSLEFAEGTMPEDERRDFESHLALCPPCLAFFETYKATPAVSRGCLMVSMPAAVKDAIKGFLRGRCHK